jgi:hypothetical protein
VRRLSAAGGNQFGEGSNAQTGIRSKTDKCSWKMKAVIMRVSRRLNVEGDENGHRRSL